jgi:LacI family transcriptional regulator
MRISQRDVARRLGLSNATVSRALRQDPRIPVETRRRVEAACEELGYRPDPILSELASSGWRAAVDQRATTIAFIICVGNKLYADPFVSLIRKHAAALGYRVEVFNRIAFESSAKLEKKLRNLGLSNLILGRSDERELMVELNWEKFISVQLLPGLFSQPLHSVVLDHFNTVIMTWRQVVNHGYRRIGITLLDHRPKVVDDVIRSSAVYACQKQLFPELAAIPPFQFSGTDPRPAAFSKWVKKHQPDAIIGFNFTHHLIFKGIFGHTIPYACLYHFTNTNPEYACTLERTESCAREAVALLHFCRQTYQWGAPKERIDHVVEPLWFEGTSLPIKEADAPKKPSLIARD